MQIDSARWDDYTAYPIQQNNGNINQSGPEYTGVNDYLQASPGKSGQHITWDDDPWAENLFRDIELDEVRHLIFLKRIISRVSRQKIYTEHQHVFSSYKNKKQMNTANNVEHSDGVTQQATADDSTEQMNPSEEGAEDGKEICEEDVENFLENEESNSQGQNDYTIDKDMIPEVGMQFENRENAQVFFNMYAYAIGFSVSVVAAARTTSKKRNREVIRVTMKCNKYARAAPAEKEDVEVQRQTTVIDRT